MKWIQALLVLLGLGVMPLQQVAAQGQDSTIVERDRQVIATLLPGVWNNNNQSYFDRRLKVADDDAHGRLHIHVESDAPMRFTLQLRWGSTQEAATNWSVELADGEDAVAMTLRNIADKADAQACVVLWRREAAQFRGAMAEDARCGGLPVDWVLSEDQMWLGPLTAPGRPATASAFKLHRTRAFKCYADIPGVGGGRDEPFERYGEYDIHDGGGLIRFSLKGSPDRKLGISLWRVDWPINNYEGVFTRDVLVLSVLEFLPDDTVIDHGYTFTEPTVGRLGVNLKWMLASCYTQSNVDQRPFM